MRLPAALLPLRHTVYRRLWLAYVVTSLGTWLQNTGAGWLMTSLDPAPLLVAMVQAATILPAFLLALPGGALADIVDRRRFLIGTQGWTMLVAALLAALTLAHQTGAWGLLALTFAIGIGSALTAPAWSAIVPELVPRGDLVPAIALNGIGFNLARALGPALAGFLVLLGGCRAHLRALRRLDRRRDLGAGDLAQAPPGPAQRPATRASALAPCAPAPASSATPRRCARRWCAPSPTRCRPPRHGRCCPWWCASSWGSAPGCTVYPRA